MELLTLLLFTFNRMNSTSDYKVSLGKVARTILYEDSQGTILFTFDVDTAKEKNAVILERPANNPRGTVEQSRIDLAFERTKQHLLTQGHQVKIWPDEFEK
jgi:hypothetical protein